MQASDWNPVDILSWSRALGLVCVPMFPDDLAKKEPGNHAVLMDGKASFCLSICDDVRELEDKPVSWSWSSDVNHAIVIDSQRKEFYIRRWDYPTARRFRLPSSPRQAGEVIPILIQGGLLRAPDVVSRVLRGFRQVRAALHAQNAIEAVKVFLALLVAAERRKLGKLSDLEINKIKTAGDLVGMLDGSGGVLLEEVKNIETQTKKALIGTLLVDFAQPQPITGCVLEPSLLLRHASGRLFQEANLVVERENGEQMHLAGLAPEKAPAGKLERDVRYTPATLARTLAERTLNALPSMPKKICAFDPACGSGIFLQELLRELQHRTFEGEVTLKGFDISEISCVLSKFCLTRAISENKNRKLKIKVEINECDALQSEWPNFDVALMNPPFVPYERMDGDTRNLIRTQLGELSQGRSDKAMAFVWKAVQQMNTNKAIGAVIPAPLLETKSGEAWRSAIAKKTDLCLLGKFHGFGYFAASLVEPGFLVLKGGKGSPLSDVKVVLAEGGFEDESLRALRLNVETSPSAVEGWEIYSAPINQFNPENWMPRAQTDLDLLKRLEQGGFSTVGELFKVRQGVRSGCDSCFILSKEDFKNLSLSERKYFRPSATNSTIREGRVFPGEWIFYPYDGNGPIINDEVELKNALPLFYAKNLKPAKTRLQGRPKIDPDKWWLLTWERGWQREKSPKLVSASFGGRGRFACDVTGEFVTVQGHAWIWDKTPEDTGLDLVDTNRWFFSTDLPYAYLAIFNSKVFERLLSLFCPRVQGGQFDLSNRFVDKLPLADLSQFSMFDADLCRLLVDLGRAIHDGNSVDSNQLERAVSRLYKINL